LIGEKPGSERGDKEALLFMDSLASEDRLFLLSQDGLGNSQKAEVAWLERRLKETGNEGYRYEKLDVQEYVGRGSS
jgi:hypothetical protein